MNQHAIPMEDGRSAWTPGPWQAFPMEKHALKGFVIDTAFGNNANNDYVIADHIFGEHAEANARLIAAAPDYDAFTAEALPLLEVLHSTVQAPDTRKIVWRCILKGRAAAAKSRGETL